MDIYFAVLNFTLSGAIGLVGILTLNKVSTPKEVLFALLPLLFALHQFDEGFVWLGMNEYINTRALEIAAGIFVYYAQGLLPFLVPLAIWLIEKDSYKRKLVGILTIFGFGLAIYTMYGLTTVPTNVSVVNNTLYYRNPWTENFYDASIYVLTTCGSLMLSSSISIQLFGFLNLIGLTIIFLLRPYGFTSLWCLYAAAISGLLYFYFIERRIKFLQEIKRKKEGINEKFERELNKLEKSHPKLFSTNL
ncbi:DUF6629 family protein [Sulfurimonas autotrophica]|uniref:Uncharacterized protein n=1 Tax=Sulfurimonas autotrophica (strain ATCC BAA-671 / DSM 16294 / JCM 11897 / OK10) TaxID=563040 RepID=E0UTW1_SULAO|nr:DUF6629 family protein [Sulfurimonas autotrophica]ADN09405.1 conserved hypothetical protein [Sulfurimonas autotrophica DSM 16294]